VKSRKKDNVDVLRWAPTDRARSIRHYRVTGQYDIVTITEAPNDEAVAKVALATASKGSLKTETLRAFTEDEYWKIIAALP